MGASRAATVRFGLDERVEIDQPGLKRVSYRRHATARPVEIERHGEAFLDLPEVGDPWEPLTVRARLERMAETYGRLPRVRPSAVRSCMPDTVREAWKDEPRPQASTDRALDEVDIEAANVIVDVLTSSQRAVAWAIAQRKSDRWLGRMMGMDGKTASKLKQDVLSDLATNWNMLRFRPDAEDVKRARKFLHR